MDTRARGTRTDPGPCARSETAKTPTARAARDGASGRGRRRGPGAVAGIGCTMAESRSPWGPAATRERAGARNAGASGATISPAGCYGTRAIDGAGRWIGLVVRAVAVRRIGASSTPWRSTRVRSCDIGTAQPGRGFATHDGGDPGRRYDELPHELIRALPARRCQLSMYLSTGGDKPHATRAAMSRRWFEDLAAAHDSERRSRPQPDVIDPHDSRM